MKCPEGHDCGVRSTKHKGVCTPLSCCQLGPKIRPEKTLAELSLSEAGKRVGQDDKVPASEMRDTESEEQDVQKTRRQLGKLKRRMEERHTAVGFTGHDLQGADAEEYVQKRIVALSPRAMAEQEYRLFMGNDAARDSASRFILESSGHGKKDGPSVGSSPVLILTGIEVPWAKKTVAAAGKALEMLDAQVTPAQRGASNVAVAVDDPATTGDEDA